jgi:DNA polymerase-1
VPRLFLIDSYGFIFRAHFARARTGAPPMRTKTGQPTEAVYIFHNMLRKLIATHKPDYIAAVFESLGPTFRDQEFKEYKANRAETPPDLLTQVPHIRRLLEAMRITILEYPGFEADDVIGTLSCRAADQGLDVVIVSSDKDLLQLVNPKVAMFNPMKEDQWFDERATEEFMGVKPPQVADLLALKGDAIDNIPGAPGIGDKGARDIVQRFGSVEAALERAAEVERKMYRESLQNNRDQILLSKKLATVETNVPIELDLDATTFRPPDKQALKQVYQDMEFFSLLKELGPTQSDVPRDYRRLTNDAELDEWLAKTSGPLAIAVAPPSEEAELASPEFGLAWKTGEGRTWSGELPQAVIDRVAVAHDAKSTSQALSRVGVNARFQHDAMLYGFLVSADPGGVSFESLVQRYLDRDLTPDPSAHAECIICLSQKLREEVEQRGLREVYDTIDLPLVDVLLDMEATGIRVDPDALQGMSVAMEAELERLAGEIFAISNRPFNINSPQQLSKVLFEELEISPPGRAPKGKAHSTAADVLEQLAEEHPIARKVLDYRQVAKLKGTYADALPDLINPETGRVHTTFNQAGAATGRLSSSNPNLQNIPIRTELGREIRAAFVPREGWTLVVADYSQIELRLLAHMSRDPVLVDAFRNGEDIHTRTAAEVFGVPPLMITPDQRRNAKAVNFGIVYGQTSFGLAQTLGIDRKEADIYIRAYFERYSGVRKWLDRTMEEVRKSGYSVTLHGRQRPIPDMQSRNPTARGFAERTAVNTPLQGTAADLIKLAMIRIYRKLQGMQAKMLLQVHDELIFEAPPNEVDTLKKLVKSEMENVVDLEVPLIADVGAGQNWRDAK